MSSVKVQGNASGTGVFTVASPNSNNTQTLTLPDNTGTLLSQGTGITAATAVNSTSGTSIDFTGIPSWVKRITFLFNGISTNGSSLIVVRLGSTTFATTGYLSYVATVGSTGSSSGSDTTGFLVGDSNAAVFKSYGTMELNNITGNTWVSTLLIGLDNGAGVPYSRHGGGNVSLGGALDRVRLTTLNGTDTFDAGSVNIFYQG